MIPTKPDEINSFVQIWSREAILLGSGLYVSAEDVDDSSLQQAIKRVIECVSGPVFLATYEPWHILSPSYISIEVNKPS